LEFDHFAMSPDGKHLVLNGTGADGIGEVWLRSLDAVAAVPLPGTGSGKDGFWSPDSGSIAFFSQNKLARVDRHAARRLSSPMHRTRVAAPGASAA
jgi:hypothetical protein